MENNFNEIGNSGYTTTENGNFNNAVMSLEERMLRAYMGNSADNILKSKINIVAAILGQSVGPVWFFFRKAHLVGFAFLLITILVGMIASRLGIDKAYYIMAIIYLFTATPIYLWDAKRKISKILANNSYASEEELIEMAKTKGGTSIVAAVIYGVLFFVLIAFLIFAMVALMFLDYQSIPTI